jgi:hypothetical protein
VVFAGLDKIAFSSVYSSAADDSSDAVFVEYPDVPMEQYVSWLYGVHGQRSGLQ